MFDRFKPFCEGIVVVYVHSSRFKVAYWIAVLVPIAVLAVGLLVPEPTSNALFAPTIKSVSATMQGLVLPLLALATAGRLWLNAANVFGRERRRLYGI